VTSLRLSISVGKKFLRGYQITDSSGAVQFTTIYPGWYSGRTIHIHFRIRTASGSTNFTSQLFFDDTISDQVLAAAPYNTRGTRNTTNRSDIYTAATLLNLSGDTAGGFVGTSDVALNGLPATTPSPAATASPTPVTAASCTGDCDGNGSVTVDEVLKGVNIALGEAGPSTCAPFDGDGSGVVTIDELLEAVSAALNGCGR
jgi:hypothetical protein